MHEGRCESLSGLNCKKVRVKKILVSNFGGSVLLRGKCFAEPDRIQLNLVMRMQKLTGSFVPVVLRMTALSIAHTPKEAEGDRAHTPWFGKRLVSLSNHTNRFIV